MTTPAPTAPIESDTPNLTSLLDTITRADTGDAQAVEHLRECFHDVPKVVDVVSGLAHNAETAILANVSPGAQELFRQQGSNLRRDLRGDGTGSVLETILIRRVCLDYMASLQADLAKSLAPGESRSLELARFYDQQADRAHRRFLSSVESLARVRKLITPIQINIAKRQVNVAGTVTTGKRVHDERQ